MKRAVCPARTAACTMFLASMVLPRPGAPTSSTLAGRARKVEGRHPLEQHGGTPAPLGGLGDEVVEVVGGARPVEPAKVTRQGRRDRVG